MCILVVQAAEEMAEEDKAMKDKVEARNKLENYVYSVRNTVKDEKKGGKLPEEDRQALRDKIPRQGQSARRLERDGNRLSVSSVCEVV